MKSPSVTDFRAYFLTLARHNVWATGRLYEYIDELSEDDYRRDAGLFFKSVHGTLNHLLVAEHRVWFPRFAEGVSNRVALNEEVETDRAKLRGRLVEAAGRWRPLIESFDVARFAGTLDYSTTKGVAQSLAFAPTLGHVFNHATHHRGQITAAITAMGYPCPEIDMVWMLQAESREQTQ
jgi:uncharacterized damage-inducible protein DinB